jgi:hypothetical protein
MFLIQAIETKHIQELKRFMHRSTEEGKTVSEA